MKKETYLKQREEMVNKLAELIEAGLSDEEFKAKQKEIMEFDNKFEESAKQKANLESLKQPEIVNLGEAGTTVQGIQIEAQNINLQGGQPTMKPEEMKNIAFAKKVLGQELTAEEMKNVEYASDNQIVIPTVLMNEIIGDLSTLNPFFGDARKFNVAGVITLPKHVAITAGDAKFEDEKVEKTAQDNDFATVTLSAKEVSKLIETSFQLEAMSVPAFLAFLRKEIVDRVGAVVGEAVFYGNGTTEFQGVFTGLDTVASQRITLDTFSYDKAREAMGALDSKAVNGAVWYANSKTVWGQLAGAVDGNGRPFFIESTIADGSVGRILGRPVKVDDGLKDDDIVLANASRGYGINTVQSLSIQTDKDLKRRVNQYLAYGLWDGAVLDEKAIVLITNTPAGGVPTP